MLLKAFGYLWIVIIAGVWLAWTAVAIKDGICYFRRNKEEETEHGLCFVHWAVFNGFVVFMASLFVFASSWY